jgi:hypothetical protein
MLILHVCKQKVAYRTLCRTLSPPPYIGVLSVVYRPSCRDFFMGAAFFGDSGLHVGTFQCDPELDGRGFARAHTHIARRSARVFRRLMEDGPENNPGHRQAPQERVTTNRYLSMQLLALVDRIVVGVDDIDINSQAAGCLSSGSLLFPLEVVISGGKSNQELSFFQATLHGQSRRSILCNCRTLTAAH